MELSLNVYYTIALAVIILLVGDFIKKRCYILRKFCIPVPVVGGLLLVIGAERFNLRAQARAVSHARRP